MIKSQIPLKFLFWTIVGLLFFIPVSLWASQFFKLSDKSTSSYSKLLQLVSEIKDGELLSMPLYMDDNTAIIGVSKNSDKFEAKIKDPPVITAYFEHNDPKCANKACICLCKEIEIEDQGKITCEEKKCSPFDKIDFLETRPLTDFSVPQPHPGLYKYDYTWENGFAIITQTDVNDFLGDKTILANVGFGGLADRMKKKLKAVYIQRYKNFVNVCYNQTCIPDELKKLIAEELSIIIKVVLGEHINLISQEAESKGIDKNLALGLAYQESLFSHCKDGSLDCGTSNKANVNCNLADSCGIMQLTKRHCAWFKPELCSTFKDKDDLPSGCFKNYYESDNNREGAWKQECEILENAQCDPEQTALDLQCNIKLGITFLKHLYNEHSGGVSYSCTNQLGSVDTTYTEWDAALRAYNGLGCGPNADPEYVENVNNKKTRIETGKIKIE